MLKKVAAIVVTGKLSATKNVKIVLKNATLN
jgi:hypothetical protein